MIIKFIFKSKTNSYKNKNLYYNTKTNKFITFNGFETSNEDNKIHKLFNKEYKQVALYILKNDYKYLYNFMQLYSKEIVK